MAGVCEEEERLGGGAEERSRAEGEGESTARAVQEEEALLHVGLDREVSAGRLPPAQAASLAFEQQVERALEQLRATPETTLLEPRGVGRLQLPSTVVGLLVHAAEHTQRHVGQIVTTAKIVQALGSA